MPNAATRVALGNTGLKVSQLALGTAPLGNLLAEIPEDQAEAAFAAALDAGINYIDTAPFYGYGLAEERAGRALQGRNRSDFVISTKVGRLIRPGERSGAEVFDGGKSFYLAKPGMMTQRDYSYDGVMTSLDESLTRLGTDYVDLLHIHDPDDHFDEAVKGAYPALAKLREEGVIKGVSAGMNQWEMLSNFMDHGHWDAFLLAGRYTLLDQTGLPELLPKCVDAGTAIIAGGVYNSGLLADPRPGITYNYMPVTEDILAQALRIKAVCEAHDVPLKAAAIQFPLAHPAVPTILTGVRSADEFTENLQLFETDIPDALWGDLRAEGLLPADAPTPA
ncbi:aldo/keto reductase [Actibacterium mucosum KCTC 23349]|uniref:Aldo/keto reductase n=1 Tax=Actibacterium mucosum KCTC 23349 TaxID=1454373 RepID=A0A037ZKX5_9RHOB|nr:aldo/keto reductase [Actibacterium mucosum]KAJ55456.1 aldo/keto reductase [Actibacterium mucosum KCTC 23349]